jgi:hypothetical protein
MGTNQQKQSLARRYSNESSGGRGARNASPSEATHDAVAGNERGIETRIKNEDTGRQDMECLRTKKLVEIPLFPVDREGVYVRNIEGKLSLEQARVLNGLTEELRSSGVELEDGQKVRKAIHAIRWLIEKIR